MHRGSLKPENPRFQIPIIILTMFSESEPSVPLMAITSQQRNSERPPNPEDVQPFSLRTMSCNDYRVLCSESEPSPPLMAISTQQRNSEQPPNPIAVQPFSLRKMSCNGCRVLRKGCSDDCILRQCLQWIDTPQSQANATLFVAKFFGRAGLMTFIQGVQETDRPALFKSLLYEACGRTINPVHGAVGLLWAGKWYICQAAVQKVLKGGNLDHFTPPMTFSSSDTNRAMVSSSHSTQAVPNSLSIGANKTILPTLPSRNPNGVAASNSPSIDAIKATTTTVPPSNTNGVAVPSFSSIDRKTAILPTLPPRNSNGVLNPPNLQAMDAINATATTVPSSDYNGAAMPSFSSIDGNIAILTTSPMESMSSPILAVESQAQAGNTLQDKFDIHGRTGIPEFSVVDNEGACKRPTDDDLSKLYELGNAITTVNRRVRQRTEDRNNIDGNSIVAVNNIGRNNVSVPGIDRNNIGSNSDDIQNIGQVSSDGNIEATEVTSAGCSGQQQKVDMKLDLSLNCQKSSNLKQQRVSSPSSNSVNSEGSVNRQISAAMLESTQKLLDLI